MNLDKLIEKFVDILNGFQRNIFICLIILFPLCYTFLFLYSDSFVQQDILNKFIFSITLDICLLYMSISLAPIISMILDIDNDNLVYIGLGICFNVFVLSIYRKYSNTDTTFIYPTIILLASIFIMAITVFFLWLKKKYKKKSK